MASFATFRKGGGNMKTIRFKEFGYYNGNHLNACTVEVDDGYAAYMIGKGRAVEESTPEDLSVKKGVKK